jgi:hypothetical protein
VYHEWCEVYDESIEELNKHLHHKLPDRNKEYIVRVEIEQTRTVVVDVVVTAKSKDEASDLVADDVWNYVDEDDNDFSWFIDSEDVTIKNVKEQE